MDVPLFPRKQNKAYCGFLQRANNHSGSFTIGIGTFCSDCHERIFNPHYNGSYDTEGDMEIVNKLRKKGARIPKEIQEEITEFQKEVGWKPVWVW